MSGLPASSLPLIDVFVSSRFVVFGIAQSLGNIKATSKPVVWAIGYTRDPALQYTDLSNVEQDRFLYYKANYSSDDLLVSDLLALSVLNSLLME